jgi:hypothetical protein
MGGGGGVLWGTESPGTDCRWYHSGHKEAYMNSALPGALQILSTHACLVGRSLSPFIDREIEARQLEPLLITEELIVGPCCLLRLLVRNLGSRGRHD